MNLTPRQLAKLRELARSSNELELRHEARRAALATQREYLVTLTRRLEQLLQVRDAALRNATTVEQHDSAVREHNQGETVIREEILTARAELEQLQDQLSQITQVSAPLRDLIDRILQSANLTPRAVGIAFGDDDARLSEHVALGAR